MKSKSSFIICAVIIFNFQFLFSQEQIKSSEFWLQNLETAIEEKVKSDLPLLIDFSVSDWCRPCIQLKRQVFSKEEFIVWASAHVIPVHFEFPRQRQNALPREQLSYNDLMTDIYNPKGASPKVIIADKTGKEIGSLGFMNVDVMEYI